MYRVNYGALLGSKLIMQTFLYNYFRIATLVARLIDNEVFFLIFFAKTCFFLHVSWGVFFFTITFELQLLSRG